MEGMKRILRQVLLTTLAASLFVLACTGCSYLPELPALPDLPFLGKDKNQETEKETTAPPCAAEVKPNPASTSPKPAGARKPTAPNKPSFFVHTVKWPRETLSIIAKWYTGNFDNWKALGEANPNIVPHRIYVNDKVLIPENLLRTRNSMPRSFVDKYTPPPSKKHAVTKKTSPGNPSPQPSPPRSDGGVSEAKAETKQPEPQDPELFGPKEYSGR